MLLSIRAVKPEGWMVTAPGRAEVCPTLDELVGTVREMAHEGRDSLDELEAAYKPLVPQVLPMRFHPLTCPHSHGPDEQARILVERGGVLHCPTCDYTQQYRPMLAPRLRANGRLR